MDGASHDNLMPDPMSRRRFVAVAAASAASTVVACKRSSSAGAGAPSATATSVARLSDVSAPTSLYPRRKAGLNLHGVDAPTLSWMKKLGITRVRISAYLNVWLDDRDLNRDGVVDNVAYRADLYGQIRTLRAAGIDVVVLLTTPQVGVAITDPNGQPAFIAMAKHLATDHPRNAYSATITWQIMNEWDAEPEFGPWFTTQPTLYLRGAAYGRFMAAVYDAIKSVDPTVRVITGGLASRNGAEQIEVYRGLASTNNGNRDGVAWHFYGTVSDMLANATALRAAATAIGSTDPLLLTEWGAGDRIPDPQAQAAFIGAALTAIDQNPTLFNENYLYVWRGGAPTYAVCNDDNTLRPAALLLEGRTAN